MLSANKPQRKEYEKFLDVDNNVSTNGNKIEGGKTESMYISEMELYQQRHEYEDIDFDENDDSTDDSDYGKLTTLFFF